MNFKLPLFITIAIGALMVVAQPPPSPGPDQQCYEDCLKKATSAQGAGDQPSDTTTSADQARGAGMTK
ncbi:hypothetical protein K492DRAFT_200399 [Lichtheimia hyalospora FSU 10163]|nr:hypothetical protein K492DRAFT_200399 [Lichtheimia hyalospora FSU 10163]